jgi:hypothetical protein
MALELKNRLLTFFVSVQFLDKNRFICDHKLFHQKEKRPQNYTCNNYRLSSNTNLTAGTNLELVVMNIFP